MDLTLFNIFWERKHLFLPPGGLRKLFRIFWERKHLFLPPGNSWAATGETHGYVPFSSWGWTSEEQNRIPTPPCPKSVTLILEKSLGVRAQAISIQRLVLIPEILDKCLELCSNESLVRWGMTVQERVTKSKKTRREWETALGKAE